MRQKQRHPIHGLAIKSAILSYLAGTVVVGYFAGKWIDDFFGTNPLFLIVCLLLGLAVGIYAVIKMVHHYFLGD